MFDTSSVVPAADWLSSDTDDQNLWIIQINTGAESAAVHLNSFKSYRLSSMSCTVQISDRFPNEADDLQLWINRKDTNTEVYLKK